MVHATVTSEQRAVPLAWQDTDVKLGVRTFAPRGLAAAGTRGAGESGRKHPLGRTDRTFKAGICLPETSPNAQLQEKE